MSRLQDLSYHEAQFRAPNTHQCTVCKTYLQKEPGYALEHNADDCIRSLLERIIELERRIDTNGQDM